MTSTLQAEDRVGPLLREWRSRRRRSQLDVSADTGISTRHLSYVETGRSKPSRVMVLRLAEHYDVPLRERNTLLLAAGYAPAYRERSLADEEMAPVRGALEQILAGYEPYPALVIDRGWHMLHANAAVAPLIEGVAPELLEPPVNVLRLSLHPHGMSPRIVNLAEWRGHLIDRLAREAAITGDEEIAALVRELRGYPGGEEHPPPEGRVAVPLRVRSDAGELCFISTVTTFGTAVDIALAELSIEAFLPADEATARILRGDG
ncbi:helix-turn-helix domain-containing protein [Nocardioides limicola]|uniref:helix-turn-helix domain-containing protein n=1 Tax=Nocardioides limicola TaxID=2803368 RepID=UPI00193BF1BA|nr:helix-turn-helix domain-containing protein [Nocardioides sp. DJM-14]